MKKITLFILYFFSTLNIFSQDFKNIDLSQLCNTSTIDPFDPFFVGNSNKNCTLPWEVSHGTPQINPWTFKNGVSSQVILLFGGKEPIKQGGRIVSEGVFFRYPFKKGRRYPMKITYESGTTGKDILGVENNPMDKLIVGFANSLQTVTTISSNNNNINSRSYESPNVSSKQEIHSKTDIDGFFQIDKTIDPVIADNDYEALWLRVEDDETYSVNNRDEQIGQAIILIKIEILCDDNDVAITVPTTEIITPDYAIRKPLKKLTQAASISIPCLTGPVAIKGSEYYNTFYKINFRKDPKTVLEASKKIEILSASRNSTAKYFEAGYGSTFEAKINSLCLKDECGDYIPFYEAEAIKYPTAIDPYSDIPSRRKFIAIATPYYPKPYNAFKARLTVFANWGLPDEKLFFDKTWEDRKNGLTDKQIEWTPNAGTFYGSLILGILTLENCEEIKEIRFYMKVFNLLPDGGGSVDALIRKSTPIEPYIKLYPTNTDRVLNIDFSLAKEVEQINFSIFDLTGRKVLEDKVGKMEIGEYQRTIDVSKLSTGVYFLKMDGSETRTSPMKFVKI
jgi:Secretion system C-terminal sorting domain